MVDISGDEIGDENKDVSTKRNTNKDVGNIGSSGLLDTIQGHMSDMRMLIQCSICTMPMHEPFTIACGHTFCYSCLLSWFTNSGQRKKTCPECRGPVKKAPAPSYIVRTLVQMFTSRAELLDTGETTVMYAKHREEALQELESDKANSDPLSGGIFKGIFRDSPLRPTVDVADGVSRCPICNWEIENNVDCVSCGYIFGQDSDVSDGDESDDESAFSFASPESSVHEGDHEDENEYDESDSFVDDEDVQPIDVHRRAGERRRRRAEQNGRPGMTINLDSDDDPMRSPRDPASDHEGAIVRNFGIYYHRTREQGEWHYRSLGPHANNIIDISSDYTDGGVIETGNHLRHRNDLRSEDDGVYAESYDSVDSEDSPNTEDENFIDDDEDDSGPALTRAIPWPTATTLSSLPVIPSSDSPSAGDEEYESVDESIDDEEDHNESSLTRAAPRPTATPAVPSFPSAITIHDSDESDDEPVGPVRRAPQGRAYRFSPY